MRLFFIILLVSCAYLGFAQTPSTTKAESIDFLEIRKSEDLLHSVWLCRDESTFSQRDTLIFYNIYNFAPLKSCKAIGWTVLTGNTLHQSFYDYCEEPPQISVVFDKSDEYKFSLETYRKATLLKLTNYKGKDEYFKVSHARVIDKSIKQEYSVMTLVRLKNK